MRISDWSSDVCSSDLFGTETFGDLVYPVNYDRRKKYPLIVVQYISRGFLSGGVGDEFTIKVFANRGYAVLSIQRPNIIALHLESHLAAELERRLLTHHSEENGRAS